MLAAPAANGVSASARRWVLVRGSSGQTVAASSFSFVSKAAASGARTLPPDLGHAVLAGLDLDVAVEVALTSHAHRLGVKVDHHPVDEFGDLLPRQLVPARRRAGQFGVDAGQHVLIDDQIGAKDRGGDDPEVHLAGREYLTQPREPLQ
jgi:hypothetical protein